MAKKEEKAPEKQTVIVIKNEISIDNKPGEAVKVNTKPTLESQAPMTIGPVYIPKSKKNLTTFDGLVEQSVNNRRGTPMRGITVK